MQQLTGLDASFLALETASTTGHVGGLCLLDPGDAPRPLDLARLTESVTAAADGGGGRIRWIAWASP